MSRSPPQGGLAALQVIDNTDDAEPQMVQNAQQMVQENKHKFIQNDPDLNSRQKMKISFDPFEPSNAAPIRQRADLANTFESKVLRNLDSPKSVQSNPHRIPESQQQIIEKQKLIQAQFQATGNNQSDDYNQQEFQQRNPQQQVQKLPDMNGTMYNLGSMGSGHQQYIKDPKLLTKSTINGQQFQYGGSFGGGNNQQFIIQQQKNQGYVSDYYKNKNVPEGYNKNGNGQMNNGNKLPQMMDQSMHIDPQHQLQFKSQNKISSNKFFKSKIDFTAPIKSLQKQNQDQYMQNNLSDDSQDNQQPQMIQGIYGQQFQQYPLRHPANLQPSYRQSKGRSNDLHINTNFDEQLQQQQQYDFNQNDFNRNMQNYSGANNLSLIKEEDFKTTKKYPVAQPLSSPIRESGVKQNIFSGNQIMRITKYQGKKKIKSDRGGPVKLPNLSSAYLRHPSEGLNMRGLKPPKGKRKLVESSNAKMCGLCGTKHAPGEPHRTSKAAQFNGKQGVKKKIIGGYIAPNMAKRRASNGRNMNSHRAASQNPPNQSQRSLPISNRLAMNNLAGKSQQSTQMNQSYRKKSEFQQNYNKVSPQQNQLNSKRSAFGTLPPLGGKISSMTLGDDGVEPQLVCTERELAQNIEDEIKNGFFELKQKFTETGPSSIYISHIILHQKHPIFMKCEIDTLKQLLVDSSVVYLQRDQILYRFGNKDDFIYFVLFGRLSLVVPGGRETLSRFEQKLSADTIDELSRKSNCNLGRVNIGWTIGEEILFEFDKQTNLRQESCFSETESCLLGINKSKLAMMQKNLLEQGNTKDYYVFESVLKGNYLLKSNWKKDMKNGQQSQQNVPGLSVKNFNHRDESVQMIEAPDQHQHNIDMANIYSQGINFGTLDETNKFNTIQN